MSRTSASTIAMPKAGGDGDVASDVERLRDALQDPLGDLDRLVHVADLVEQDGELVAVEPTGRVAGSDGVDEAP